MLRSEAWITVTLGIWPPWGRFNVKFIPGGAAGAGVGIGAEGADVPNA